MYLFNYYVQSIQHTFINGYISSSKFSGLNFQIFLQESMKIPMKAIVENPLFLS